MAGTSRACTVNTLQEAGMRLTHGERDAGRQVQSLEMEAWASLLRSAATA